MLVTDWKKAFNRHFYNLVWHEAYDGSYFGCVELFD